MNDIKYIRVLPANTMPANRSRSRAQRIWYGVGLLTGLAGFMLAVYIVAYTVCMINGAA